MTDTTLATLIARREALKINIDSHLRFDKAVDTPGDDLRDELGQTIGMITEALHRPFRLEGERLAEKRSQLSGELEQAQHERTGLRCAQGHAQGRRSAALVAGGDPAEHLDLSKRLSGDLHDLEAGIGHLEARIGGIDGQLIALVEAEGAAIVSGVSAA